MEWWGFVLALIAVGVGLLFVGAIVGHTSLIGTLKREGYEVTEKADMTGKKRWRVGVIEQAEEMRPVQRVRWIDPKGGADGG